MIHDPQVLRAIAHPVRNQILDELDAQGPLRAADIARELDIPANQASFHLRQLAKYGLVREDPDAARDRRDRVWKIVDDAGTTVSFEELEATPGGAAASAVFRDNAASWGQYVVQQAWAAERTPDTVRQIVSSALRLSKEEAEDLARELDAVVVGWSARRQSELDMLEDGTERRTYLYYGVLQPHPGRPTAEDA